MPIETSNFIPVLLNQLPWGLFFKVIIIIFLSFYSFFGIIVVKQVSLMNKTIVTSLDSLLGFIALTHLVVSLILLVASIVLL